MLTQRLNRMFFTLLVGSAVPLSADVKLPAIFSDHMVLQKAASVPVWGTASPHEALTVTVDKTQAKVTAGSDGKWQVILDLSQEGPGPFEMTVQGSNKLTVTDVAIGEVWLASGQSNMTMSLKDSRGAAEEIAKSADPLFRSFLVKSPDTRPKNEPQVDAGAEGKWIVASPEESGSFTAIGYYFGKTLRQKLQVPVGIIHASVGGSSIESWLTLDSFDQDPDLKTVKDRMLDESTSYPARMRDFITQYRAWESQYQRADHPADPAKFDAPDTPMGDWKAVQLPGDLSNMGLPESGAVWFRRTVEVPPQDANKYVPVYLGTLRDFDAVYWNGTKIGETTPDSTTSHNMSDKSSNDRRYDAPGSVVKAGDNTLAIRLFSPGGNAGFDGQIRPVASTSFNPLPMTGDWMAKVEFELPALTEDAKSSYPVRPLQPPGSKQQPSHLYTSMIQPLIPYAIRGFIWDQGEANTGRAFQYRTSFRLLIEGWRAAWKAGDLPFYFVQLQNGGKKTSAPQGNGAAELREAQSMALALPNTGMAVTIDLGEETNPHYKDKKDAGERLALPALVKTYGQSMPYSGPTYDSMKVEAGDIRITFQNSDGGLVAKPLPDTYQPNTALPATKPLVRNSPGSDLEGFAICGDDYNWVWANATIAGNTVIVSSTQVPSPVAVRYAWSENPTCNLYNGAGLPASPFRTDDEQAVTFQRKYGSP